MTKSDFELMMMALSSLSFSADSDRSSVETQPQLAEEAAETRNAVMGLTPARAVNCEEKFGGAGRNRTDA